MLSIQLLGIPLLLLDGEPLSISRRKSRALLFYVAAHTAPVAREQVLALFWPDHDRTSAQQILRTSLHGLRKALGAALRVSDNALALAPDVDVDTRRFESYLVTPSGDLETLAATLALYRGDFLAGFSVPDVEDFDDWIAATRERYRQLELRGLVMLAQLQVERHDYPAALDSLARALALNPLQEDIQRAAMRAEYLSGDRAGAIRRYEQLRRLLDDELGVPPMDDTRALYDAIIKDEVGKMKDELPSPAQRSSPPLHPSSFIAHPSLLPFIGRDAELRQLRDLASSHRLVLIEGEPGIGKTRLANAFIQSFAGLALVGAAHELEQSLPYQPVIEALPSANESRLWEAFNQLLLDLARRQPVVFLLDDLHWADASTLALLGYLARQSLSAPIAFLATARLVEPRSPLAALLQTLTREDRLVRMPLSRLAADDLLALARHYSPAYSYPFAEWLVRNSEGNPYILAELVRYAREHQILQADGVVNLAALSETPVVPRTVYSLIEARLARLSGEARHRLIHRQVGEALERIYHDHPDTFAGLIASHFAEGNAPDRAAYYAFLAGQRAADLAAWAEAIAFYQQALAGADDARRVTIYLAIAEAHFQMGALAQASEACRAAIELAEAQHDQAAADRARLMLARTLIGQARYAEVIEIAQRVLAAEHPDNMVSAELLWGTALSVEGVDLAGAAEHLQRAAAFCAAQSNPADLAQIKFELGSVAAQRGDLPAAIASYREALAVAEANPSAAHYRILAHNNLAYHLLLLGDPSASAHAQTGLSLAREAGLLFYVPYLLSTLGEIALAQSDLDTAERSFTEGLELAERLTIPERIAGLTANLGLVAIRRGQTALAIHRLSTALAQADALGTRHLAAQIRIWLAPILPPAEAHAMLAEARAIAESGGRRRLLDEIDRLVRGD